MKSYFIMNLLGTHCITFTRSLGIYNCALIRVFPYYIAPDLKALTSIPRNSSIPIVSLLGTISVSTVLYFHMRALDAPTVAHLPCVHMRLGSIFG
ncbi:hypothetical protein GGR53DRAFT_511972 [Hypoxylon sp. FL1150]|nr:hypothetical protein GGR53DRAFT_511972 [Hypoxylon sp. FL1150]